MSRTLVMTAGRQRKCVFWRNVKTSSEKKQKASGRNTFSRAVASLHFYRCPYFTEHWNNDRVVKSMACSVFP